jgi:hypothetical protein
MADVDCVPEIERGSQSRYVRGVCVHLMALRRLARAAMTTAIVGDHAIALPEEEEHLGVPVVGAERPSMMKDDGLRGLGAPVLVEDFRSVSSSDGVHGCFSF